MGSKVQFSFEVLARQHMDALYTRAIQLEPNMERVEDLVQNTFLKAYNRFATVSYGVDFQKWLFSVLDDVFQHQQQCRCTA